jgi:hypothetical protein
LAEPDQFCLEEDRGAGIGGGFLASALILSAVKSTRPEIIEMRYRNRDHERTHNIAACMNVAVLGFVAFSVLLAVLS